MSRRRAMRLDSIALATIAIATSRSVCVSAVNASYDANFACCGGCSSSKRVDAHNDKLATGSHIFIWDIKLKAKPTDACLLTFPYDPDRNEQIGSRRVRSGRLVGTSYPIDHDFDSLCCEQRGQCMLLEEDASGKCHCVSKWGFTGDHCQYSIYDVASQNNSAYFPNSTDLTAAERLLPDLRAYLVDFDYETAITSTRSTDLSQASFMDVFKTGSYRQFAYATCAYFILGGAFFAVFFLLHLCWTFCCVRCGCRKKNPRKQLRMYSKATKITWGLFACLFLIIAAGACGVTFLIIHQKVKPQHQVVLDLLDTRLPTAIATFESDFLTPLRRMLATGDPTSKLSLPELQERASIDMVAHTFLDALNGDEDVIGEPVLALVKDLEDYSMFYPTVMDSATDCEKLAITPNIVSRMTVGSTTGCFRCKTCSLLSGMLADAKETWSRYTYKVQLDLRKSRLQLQEFGATNDALDQAIQAFIDRISTSLTVFLERAASVDAAYSTIAHEVELVTVYGLLSLLGLCGTTLGLGFVAVVTGVTTNKRPLARTTCFFGQVTSIIALILTGVLYTMAMMAHDGIVSLQLLDASVSIFVEPEQAVIDITRVLSDVNLVQSTGMGDTLEFSDTLHVPPHPTPYNDNPARVNIDTLYDFPELFDLAEQARHLPSARNAFFGWEEAFLTEQYDFLYVLAFGNDTVVSPYTQPIHQELLKSTAARIMDPDQDSHLVTNNDLAYIESVFNEAWRGLSDHGVEQNEKIATQWLFVARLELQKMRLDTYLTTIADIITRPKPMLSGLNQKTRAMEDAEFQLKAPVEFFTNAIRASKINDCSYDNNCGWFRDVLNHLFDHFQQIIKYAEYAAICCAISALAMLLVVICIGCFASRLRRNIVKVYSAT